MLDMAPLVESIHKVWVAPDYATIHALGTLVKAYHLSFVKHSTWEPVVFVMT